jgi:hypothetical protein
MQKMTSCWFLFLIAVFVLVAAACGAPAPAPTPAATATQAPPTSTATPLPTSTSTPVPTSTPNLAATQAMEERQAVLQKYVDAGYIDSTGGKFEELNDFQEEWPQLHWYQWWPIHSAGREYGDLVFQGHFKWSTAMRTSDPSGCGIVFGVQPNDDHYAVFIDQARIAFFMNRGNQVYQVGKTSGFGRLNIGEPFEADVTVIIKGVTSYVLVDGQPTKYTLSADQSSSGEFAYSLLSGTNRDFGTRCDITNAYIWEPQN